MSRRYESHWLERQDFGDVTVVRLKTPKVLNEDIDRNVFDPIYGLIGEVGRSKLILNLAAFEHLPSLVVGKLVMLSRKVQASDGRLALCQLCPAVEEVLEVTNLSDLFRIYATEEEALKSFS
jgi:anti-sigma B factor antagonist